MDNIPRTGRIGRFAKIVEKEVDQDVFLRIMQDSDAYAALKPEKKADWWRSALDRLENEIGQDATIEVMQACGRKCCNQGTRKSAKRLMSESDSLHEFLEKASSYGVKEGEIEYKALDEKTISGHFYRCFCGQVKQSTIPFSSLVYCQCSAEFHKQYFEAALEREVQVEITQSILNGAEHCEFLIHLR
jgi:predicted hydrocarbon binding protein